MNVDSEDNNVPFHLHCRPMCGPDICLYDITSHHKTYMVKNFLTSVLVCAKISYVYFCEEVFWKITKV